MVNYNVYKDFCRPHPITAADLSRPKEISAVFVPGRGTEGRSDRSLAAKSGRAAPLTFVTCGEAIPVNGSPFLNGNGATYTWKHGLRTTSSLLPQVYVAIALLLWRHSIREKSSSPSRTRSATFSFS